MSSRTKRGAHHSAVAVPEIAELRLAIDEVVANLRGRQPHGAWPTASSEEIFWRAFRCGMVASLDLMISYATGTDINDVAASFDRAPQQPRAWP